MLDRRFLFGTLIVSGILVSCHARDRGGEHKGVGPGIVFARDGDLHVIALDGMRTVRLTYTPAHEGEPAASPDGRSLAFTTDASRGIWIMSVDGKQRRRLTRGWDRLPAWSRDGKTVFFSRAIPNPPLTGVCEAVFHIGTSGKDLRSFKLYGGSNFDAAVSADGRIAFTAANACEGGTTVFGVLVIDAAGRRTKDLSRLPGNDLKYPHPEYEDPTWSPDGQRIAFQGIYIAKRDGSGLRKVTPRSLGGWSPAWSPDGRWIAFAAGENPDIYVIHPDGTGLRALARTEAAETSPTWVAQMPTE